MQGHPSSCWYGSKQATCATEVQTVHSSEPLLHCCCLLQRDGLSSDQRKVLEVMQRTFATYITEQPEAVTLKEKLNEAEAALAGARNKMKLGYTDLKTGGRAAARGYWGEHTGTAATTSAACLAPLRVLHRCLHRSQQCPAAVPPYNGPHCNMLCCCCRCLH